MSNDDWEYLVRHNSSVDLIERAMEFYRISANFLEVVRTSPLEEEEIAAAEAAIQLLQQTAMDIVRKETKK